MQLPKLPDMGDYEVNSNNIKESKPVNKKAKSEKKEKQSIIPKSEFDENGKPALAIPDLDDSDLKSELNRIFGKGGD